ncbi:DUF4190 domain-containing protein [Kribbella jejuensis]|uniref:Putative regulator of septum formation n=1 Tax=Kribbella jejuensis TaxID=236068 RepID=A0A542EWP1_9ACTN|nr:DUF4190 domain-containing protein [Kribbella jejuensis]TQJ19556.1 putative regulator of septum formation [Kribbella jejuensis]
MTQPPSDPDRPQDSTRSFPSYGRPEEGEGSGQQSGTSWAAPGQSTYGPASYGQAGQSSYGAGTPPQSPYGPGAYGPPQYGQTPYGNGYGPGQYPAAYGQPPAAYGYSGGSGGQNGLAVAALACALGGIFIGLSAPVAVVLGIVALVQLSRRPQAGKGMAVAGVVIGSLVTIGYVLLIGLLIAFDSSSTDDSGAPDPGSNSAYIDELMIGECFDDTSADDEVERQPCPNAHDAELIAIVSLPDGSYPGDKAIDKDADRACTRPFGTYVGKSRDQSELYLSWLTPDKYTWNSGDRRVFCVAYGPDDEKLTGTVKNSHR